MFGYALFACRDVENGIVHCYALRDGKGVDALGSIERQYFREDFKFIRPHEIEPADLRAYFLHLFPREHSEPLPSHGGRTFNEIATERAWRFIRFHPDRFDPPTANSLH